MKKVKMFLGLACLTVAIGSAAFTSANAKLIAPDYYIFTQAGQPDKCVLAPNVECVPQGAVNCIRNIAGQGAKQIFDNPTCTVLLFEKP